MKQKISGGTSHGIPRDLQEALRADETVVSIWESLTPLSRNEWICWTVSVKKESTRKSHVQRVVSGLVEGMRRPCCFMGCVHREDKSMSPTQKLMVRSRSIR